MASVKIENPNIFVIAFHQDKEDEDYGECLWARFAFDLTNYTLSIKSDCGNYAYGWKPTPELESFLQLCTRFADEYLLEKLSIRKDINNDKTWENIQNLIKQVHSSVEPDWDLDEIKNTCLYTSLESAYDDIEDAFYGTNLEDWFESEQILDCIVRDFPIGAKKIVEIFQTYIVPVLKEKINNEQDENNGK